MTELSTIYAMMSAAAYDERRDENDTSIGYFNPFIVEAGWENLGPETPELIGLGSSAESTSAGTSYTDTASGMQFDVWRNNSTGEVVIAFRGTEVSRFEQGPGGFRYEDGELDTGTLDDWSYAPESLAIWLAENLGGQTIPPDIDIDSQAQAAIVAVNSLIEQNNLDPNDVTLTGHSLGGALAAFTGYHLGLSAFLVDAAPFATGTIYGSMYQGWGLADEIPINTPYNDIYNPQGILISNSVELYLNSDYVDHLYVEGSVTDLTGTSRPFGQDGGISLTNEGGAESSFLHSAALHALLAGPNGADFIQLTQAAPRLLFNMESAVSSDATGDYAGDIFGLLGADDLGLSDSPAGDYSYGVTLSLLAVNESVYQAFSDTISVVSLATGFVGSEIEYQYSNSIASYNDPGDLSVTFGDDGFSQDTEYLTIIDLFLRVGLVWVREQARNASEQNLPADISEYFWYESGSALGFQFEDLATGSGEDEIRGIYGQRQFKELLATLVSNEIVPNELLLRRGHAFEICSESLGRMSIC